MSAAPVPRWIRFPTVHRDRIVFTCEDDLWSAPSAGGRAHRLTTGLGSCEHPRFSHDGRWIAFTGSEEGVREVYVIAADGGQLRRLTHSGVGSRVVGWSRAGQIGFTSGVGRPFVRDAWLNWVDPAGGPPTASALGPTEGYAESPDGAVAVCRHQHDLARWQGYRGGRMGQLWIRRSPDGPWVHLQVPGNVAGPVWLGDHLIYVSDHDGRPQLWRCGPDGSDPEVLTDHADLAVRFPDGDDASVVYGHGGDVWCWREDTGSVRVPIDLRSQQPRLQRRFVDPVQHLDGADLHPKGHSLVTIVRGRPFVMGNWDGPVRQLGVRDGVRYRLPRWIDGSTLLMVSDAEGREALEVIEPSPPPGDRGPQRRIEVDGLGRPIAVEVDPTGARAAVVDHRQRVFVVDLASASGRQVDQSEYGTPTGLTWSPDGAWLAWSRPEAAWGQRSSIRLLAVGGEAAPIAVTDGHYRDVSPSFDPDGSCLYFVSSRAFDPVMDTQYFDYGFVRGSRPYAVTLQRDTPHPFRPGPPGEGSRSNPDPTPAVEIDLDGLTDRIVPFPVPEGRYEGVHGVGDGRVLLVRAQVRGTLSRSWQRTGPPPVDRQLLSWDMAKQELTTLNTKISGIRPSGTRTHVAVRVGSRLRVIPARPDRAALEEVKRTTGPANRKSMWIDLARIRVAVDPVREWQQMVDEAWRLMRDHFWRSDMAGADWDGVRDTYRALLGRISTRSELSDLIWCMQGELQTSHAYEMGGDHRRIPTYRVGKLGADVVWDQGTKGFRIDQIVRGEIGDPKRSSPLLGPGVGLAVGDVITRIGDLDATDVGSVDEALVHRADVLVELEVSTPAGRRRVTVRTLADETPLRYRDWVLGNRRTVHARSEGQIGYVHIPNMGPSGFAEFHRDFLQESGRGALLVDVRWNGGGHVSQLLLDRLSRRVLGHKVPRWGSATPYPAYAVAGPMLCLTNEMAGSDGDIFTHAWKMMGLGRVVGTRTWGGVVGISPRFSLVDRTITTQPEYSSWFSDVGYGVENYGTDPDIEVDVPPHAAVVDVQLDEAIRFLLEDLAATPIIAPDLHTGP